MENEVQSTGAIPPIPVPTSPDRSSSQPRRAGPGANPVDNRDLPYQRIRKGIRLMPLAEPFAGYIARNAVLSEWAALIIVW